MENFSIWEKNSNAQRPRVDRFIPPRDSLPTLQRRLLWSVKEDHREIWYKKHQQQKKYSKMLDEVFDLEPKRRVHMDSLRAWPCAPRKKSYLSSADSILDLPTYNNAIFPELLDWSKDNYLVAALGSSYHKWSWKSQSLVSQGLANSEIQVCKFDPWGEILALGTAAHRVELHHSLLTKCIGSNRCRCQLVNRLCSITALDWSPTGRSFVMGCSRGLLVSYDRYLISISWMEAFQSSILAVRVSTDTRFVAVAAVDEAQILILTWPVLERYTSLELNMIVKSLAWHPWQSALLGIGAITTDMHAHVAVWDVPKGKLIKKDLDRNHYILDAMLFSRRTGELVVSLSTIDIPVISPTKYSDLVVLNGQFSVVDHWGEGRTDLDRVRTMIFSPEGDKLATATSGEDLIIWNFLPEDKKRKIENKSRRFSAIPVYMDIAQTGSSLR